MLSVPPLWNSARLAVSLLCMYGGATIYLLRINFSIAIVCMTYDRLDNTTRPQNETLQEGYQSNISTDSYLPSLYDVGSYSKDEICPNDDEAVVKQVM